jgi:lysophospholipase L1-like esterase
VRRNWTRRLFIGAAVAGGFCLLAEAAVTVFAQDTLTRWQAPIPPTRTDVPYLRGNPWLLWEMTPGERTELGVQVTVNSLGIRGPEVVREKPPGVRRVLIVGDSTVYGHGVADGQVFSQLLDVAYRPSVQVLNGGVPGYSTLQTLNLLQMRLMDTEPDVLVIASLWSDNNFDSFVDGELITRHGAYLRGWQATALRGLERSAVYRFLDWKLRLEGREAAVREVGWMLGRAPQGNRRRVPVNDYAANLQTLCDLMDARGGAVVFLSLANGVDLGAETTGAHAWTLYRTVMTDTAARNGAPLIDVVAAFRDSELSRDDLFLDEMHPTALGHQIISEALDRTLRRWFDGDALTADGLGGAVPSYADPYTGAGSQDDPVGPAPPADATIIGTIVSSSDTPLQIDAVDVTGAEQPGDLRLIGSERLPGPGAFTMRLPSDRPVGFLVYRDRDGDGPSAGDPRVDLRDQPVTASATVDLVLYIDLDKGTVERAE